MSKNADPVGDFVGPSAAPSSSSISGPTRILGLPFDADDADWFGADRGRLDGCGMNAVHEAHISA